jgi:hypothetical protein
LRCSVFDVEVQKNLSTTGASTSNRVLKIDSMWVKHGWWSNNSGVPELWITMYLLMPNRTICGLGKEVDSMVQLLVLNPAIAWWLYITTQIGGSGTSKFK